MVGKKLTPEEVCSIPELLKKTDNISEIARILGVSNATIRAVIQEKKWTRYSEEPPGMPDRCPDCGVLVVDDTQPCMACVIDRKRQQDKVNKICKVGN